MVGMFPPRRHFSMVIVLLLYPVVCLAGGIPEPLDSKVHVLSYDNYYRFIERHPLVLMEFYAPWCKHCQELAPHYREAAKQLSALDLPTRISSQADKLKANTINPIVKTLRKGTDIRICICFIKILLLLLI